MNCLFYSVSLLKLLSFTNYFLTAIQDVEITVGNLVLIFALKKSLCSLFLLHHWFKLMLKLQKKRTLTSADTLPS